MSITSNKLCWMGILMLAAVSGTAQAGVSLDRTRLIITGKDSSASANLTNTSPDIPFLAQSWVEDSKGNKITSPLVVLPPLQRINGGQKWGGAGHKNRWYQPAAAGPRKPVLFKRAGNSA